MIKLDAMPRIQLFALPLLLAVTLTVGGCGRATDPEPEPVAPTPPATTEQAGKTEAATDQKDAEQTPATVALPTLTPQETTTDATNESATASQNKNGQIEAADESLAAGAGEQAGAPNSKNEGMAAYMSDNFHGQATASGIIFDKDAMMAAHKSLPFESEVVVTNPKTGESVTVVIVDRLPERAETIIDVSSAAAAELDMFDAGMVWVVLEPVSP